MIPQIENSIHIQLLKKIRYIVIAAGLLFFNSNISFGQSRLSLVVGSGSLRFQNFHSSNISGGILTPDYLHSPGCSIRASYSHGNDKRVHHLLLGVNNYTSFKLSGPVNTITKPGNSQMNIWGMYQFEHKLFDPLFHFLRLDPGGTFFLENARRNQLYNPDYKRSRNRLLAGALFTVHAHFQPTDLFDVHMQLGNGGFVGKDRFHQDINQINKTKSIVGWISNFDTSLNFPIHRKISLMLDFYWDQYLIYGSDTPEKLRSYNLSAGISYQWR